LVAFGRSKKLNWRKKKTALPLAIVLALLGMFAACGGGSSGGNGGGAGHHPGTPPGNYAITVNAAVGSVTRSVQVALTVH
jgi:hypothetical protein